jgi:dephospho-CoA kinase
VKPATLTVGLTGGVGSGKSTVAALLRDLGAHIVDTDALAHRLTAAGGAAIAPIAERFGAQAITADGALDRAHMRALVFADPQARRALEAILHPMIAELTEREAALAPASAPVVFDVPLLVESGRWRARVQRVLVVDCSAATQIERVTRRNGWSAEQVQRIINQQASREARRAVADAVILNDGISPLELAEQVRQLWQSWTTAPLS